MPPEPKPIWRAFRGDATCSTRTGEVRLEFLRGPQHGVRARDVDTVDRYDPICRVALVDGDRGPTPFHEREQPARLVAGVDPGKRREIIDAAAPRDNQARARPERRFVPASPGRSAHTAKEHHAGPQGSLKDRQRHDCELGP